MFSLLAKDTAESLRVFLASVLPELRESWWTTNVLPSLSFQQQRTFDERRVDTLSGFDLAALLRVLDKNWHEISPRRNLSQEERTWTREMQHIRNKWAHAAGNPLAGEDVYRDLDTLQRFLSAIEAEPDLIDSVRQKKQECLSSIKWTPTPALHQQLQASTPEPVATEFVPGDVVYLKADPTVTGAVIQVTPGEPENRYLVFVGIKPIPFYARQLAKLDVSNKATAEPIPLQVFHAHLSALHLLHPGLANLYSLHAARVNYIPYQFKPVMKLIRSDRPRILIADEVGVGKTIEAGLIIRELQARRSLDSVLIVCPRALVTERKWYDEMRRFDEDFVHLDGPTLRHCIEETDKDGCWPQRYSKAILPFSLFGEDMLFGSAAGKKDMKKGLLDLDPLPHFDLVIVDEAHHLRNPGTWLHRGVQFLCSNAEAVVFLSATPIQLGADDLFVLLHLLRPDLILDSAVFQQMSAPNPFINRSIELARSGAPGWQKDAREALRCAAETDWGRSILQRHPDFQRIYDDLGRTVLETEERVVFIRKAETLHTFSSIINRTRRRDIGAFTVRKPETVNVSFTKSQQKLHDDITAIQAEILAQIHGDRNLMFMMTTIRRQAASCLFGLSPFLREILTRKLDLLELDEIDNELLVDELPVGTIRERVEEIASLAEKLDSHDPKLEALLKVIGDKKRLPNNKILLFSSFRHTLAYLRGKLEAFGVRVGYIHGGTPDEDRRSQRKRFSLGREELDALDVLLSSEVGCEGLDYQFCDCLVNYDLPWNPMRVEQRIGRIDRYGQRSETVAIYNLITPGTVDADIYYRCLYRIGVFHAALGGSEEIIGRLTTEIREVAENLKLTDAERSDRLQQLADNEVRIVREQEDLEEQQGELFGLRLPQRQEDDEVKQSASFWLTPDALLRLVREYISRLTGENQEHLPGERPLKTMRIGQEGREALLREYRQLPRKANPLYRDWEKWLKGSSQYLTVTFSAACAAEHRDAVFINPIHPLALQGARAMAPEQALHTAFRVHDAELKPGSYPFAIYCWKKKGIREDLSYQPVCADAAIGSRFLDLLERGEAIPAERLQFPSSTVFDNLDGKHHALWAAARSEHVSDNLELIRFRRQSLTTSHKARMAVLLEQLSNTSNEKIHLMRKSQLDSAEADFNRRMLELDQAEHQADIAAQPVAFGVMVVEGGADA